MLLQALQQVGGEPSEQERAEDKTRWLQRQEEISRLPMTWRCHDCGHLWETPWIASDQELRELTCPMCKSAEIWIE
jgi:DNA-directed RNA polymerase subunit M/transcription elongation factor TFIIS